MLPRAIECQVYRGDMMWHGEWTLPLASPDLVASVPRPKRCQHCQHELRRGRGWAWKSLGTSTWLALAHGVLGSACQCLDVWIHICIILHTCLGTDRNECRIFLDCGQEQLLNVRRFKPYRHATGCIGVALITIGGYFLFVWHLFGWDIPACDRCLRIDLSNVTHGAAVASQRGGWQQDSHGQPDIVLIPGPSWIWIWIWMDQLMIPVGIPVSWSQSPIVSFSTEALQILQIVSGHNIINIVAVNAATWRSPTL